MVDQVVLAAFKRFDVDGSGFITVEELGTVLQSLEPDDWEHDRVNELLANADSSGDGKLQIGEFLQWIFAEDPKALGLGIGRVAEYTYVISGCSRTDVNGEYVQQSKFCNHRPVFFCAANNFLLFYWKERGRWQINKRTGSKSCARLKTEGAPHMASGWEVWKKKPHSLKRGFLTESEMNCGLPPPLSPEEQIANAPKAMYTKKYGSFMKSEELFGGRPVYYNEMYKMFMLYVEPLKEWKLSVQKDNKQGEARSGKSQGYSPDKSIWMDNGEVMDVFAFDPDKSLNTSVPEGWKDPDFPHEVASLGKRFENDECEWVRALALSTSPALFNKAEPSDACQGQLGDAWLIAAIAAVAEFPNYLKDKIFTTKQASADGKYELQLFDWKGTKDWKTIQVDDYLPCVPRKKNEPGQKVFFADLSDGEMYVTLLEKAFAKLFGSYQELHYGDTAMAFASLTGCMEVNRYGTHLGNTKALIKSVSGTPVKWVVTSREGLTVRLKSDLKSSKLGTLAKNAVFEELDRDCYRIFYKKIEGEGPDSGWVSYYRVGKKTAERTTAVQWGFSSAKVGESYKKQDLQPMETDMWSKLKEADASNDLIVVNFEFKGVNSTGGPLYGTRPDGLMPRHVYSVLHAAEIPGEVWEDPKRMVCLRNPWGRCEWKGPWKDQGDEWTANEDLAKKLKPGTKFDGLFWMAWDDFEWCADTLTIVPAKIPVKRAEHEEDEAFGEED
eukprot:Skav226025  [mRNA]  locus=scaffold2502:40315:42486:+ [translate_table: standard]